MDRTQKECCFEKNMQRFRALVETEDLHFVGQKGVCDPGKEYVLFLFMKWRELPFAGSGFPFTQPKETLRITWGGECHSNPSSPVMSLGTRALAGPQSLQLLSSLPWIWSFQFKIPHQISHPMG